ncbi:MAG: sulfatase [Planctomycetes bacterium]|nr:sulfatase [Planctomycetota bacterium]
MGLSTFFGARNAFAQGDDKKLNFLFILIDDLGWRDVSCYGSKFYETPHIDKLATQGMKFTDAYAACPVCSPTRASILAGKYPATLNLTDWISGHRRPFAKLQVPKFNQQLPLEEVTIAEALKPAGYVSAAMGKWHLGKEEFYPEKQGFDLNVGGTQRGSPPSYFAPYKIPTLPDGPKGEHLPHRLAAEACRFMQANRDKPFFLYLSYYSVHTPLQSTPELIKKYKAKGEKVTPQGNAKYAGMIQSMDESVGKVLAKVDELGIADRTVVFFMSDNGGLALHNITSNAPLRAGKGSAYEGGVREPMIVRWPGVVKPGSVCSVPVTSIDFYPTILEMAGVQGDPKQGLEGVSLVPLLKQTGGIDREAIYWHYPHYHPGGANCFGAVRKGDWKLIEFYEDGKLELYNLKDDIGETIDLAQKMPEKARELHGLLKSWRKKVNAQMPTPNPKYDPAKADLWAYQLARKRRKSRKGKGKAKPKAKK